MCHYKRARICIVLDINSNTNDRRSNQPITEQEWPSGLRHRACCVQHGWSWVQAPNLHQCLGTDLQVCGSKRLSCHADLYTVSRWGESQEFIAHRWQSTQGRDPPWVWNPGRRYQKSKTGVSVAPRKGLMSSKNFKKISTNRRDVIVRITFRKQMCEWWQHWTVGSKAIVLIDNS